MPEKPPGSAEVNAAYAEIGFGSRGAGMRARCDEPRSAEPRSAEPKHQPFAPDRLDAAASDRGGVIVRCARTAQGSRGYLPAGGAPLLPAVEHACSDWRRRSISWPRSHRTG